LKLNYANQVTFRISKNLQLGKVGMKSDLFIDDEAYRLWLLLMQTRRIMFKARKNELSLLNVDADHSAIFFLIRTLDKNATPAEISRILFREPHTVSTVISRLQEAGFVRKIKDLKRKNMIRVELTEKGLDAYNKASKRESIHAIINSLSSKEQTALASLLEKLQNKALEELRLRYKSPLLSNNFQTK
jgi:DNA-binding MarR family transcriptional regulator